MISNNSIQITVTLAWIEILPKLLKKNPGDDYQKIIAKKESTENKVIQPVKPRSDDLEVPEHISCPNCNAPHQYLYFNNGVKRSQIKCKVCDEHFNPESHVIKNPAVFTCPHCSSPLYIWKHSAEVTIHKCGNDSCPKYVKELSKLNAKEKKLLKTHSSQFKLRYQYRDYHFKIDDLQHAAPDIPRVNLKKIHNSQTILGLILTFFVSFASSARKTALILKMVFNINVSYQTVLNYAEAASYYAHAFNMKYKGDVDDIQAGDETYIKIKGKYNYLFFFISAQNRKITSYHLADNRGTFPAVVAMREAIRTSKENQTQTLISDGNPSYPSGIHFINIKLEPENKLIHGKVIGLQNLDSESEKFRPFKQIIERLNRTYKYHVKPANGFNSFNGAFSLTALFVSFYNFLRPHFSLNYKPPVQLQMFEEVTTIQEKWIKLLSSAFS